MAQQFPQFRKADLTTSRRAQHDGLKFRDERARQPATSLREAQHPISVLSSSPSTISPSVPEPLTPSPFHPMQGLGIGAARLSEEFPITSSSTHALARGTPPRPWSAQYPSYGDVGPPTASTFSYEARLTGQSYASPEGMGFERNLSWYRDSSASHSTGMRGQEVQRSYAYRTRESSARARETYVDEDNSVGSGRRRPDRLSSRNAWNMWLLERSRSRSRSPPRDSSGPRSTQVREDGRQRSAVAPSLGSGFYWLSYRESNPLHSCTIPFDENFDGPPYRRQGHEPVPGPPPDYESAEFDHLRLPPLAKNGQQAPQSRNKVTLPHFREDRGPDLAGCYDQDDSTARKKEKKAEPSYRVDLRGRSNMGICGQGEHSGRGMCC